MNCIYTETCPLVIDKPEECNTACIRYSEIKYLLNTSGIPENRQKFQNLITEKSQDYDMHLFLDSIEADIVNFVKNGENLILHSEKTGNGKTSWAIQMMLAYFDSVWAGNGYTERATFVHVPTFLSRYKTFKDDEKFSQMKDRLPTIDLVVLDDVGTNKMSDFDISLLTSIIDQRILAERSIIVTTNKNELEFVDAVGKRIADRLWSTSTVVHFENSSYRGVR